MAHSPTRPPPLDPEPLRVDGCSGTDVARLGASTDHDGLPGHVERAAILGPDQEAFILRLPVEVLMMIVELAVSGSRESFNDHYGVDRSCTECDLTYNKANAKAACLVSRTFRDIAQPILFRVIDLRSPKAASRIRYTLLKNVHLRKHCRQFSIVDADGPSRILSSQWKEILRWSANVQCVQICVEMFPEKMCRNLIQKLATHAHQLKHLSLLGKYFYSNMLRIVNTVEFPRLTKLDIDRLGCDDWDRTLLDLDKQRISPVISLTIGDEIDDPECALNLITWPKALENFTFQRISSVEKFPTILQALTNSLMIHENTLKSVDISHVSHVSHLFDARLFPNLEYLRLSRWHLEVEPLEFTQEYTRILGPRLKILVWNFNDSQDLLNYLGLEDFRDEDELWLRELAKAAAGSKLQELRIEFTPVRDDEETMELFHYGFIYPWDRMNKVRDTVMRQIGVSLTYNEPSVSRDIWDLHELSSDYRDLTNPCYDLDILAEANPESESEVESEVESVVESERELRGEEEVEEVESEHD
jgi:hypothetical protein